MSESSSRDGVDPKLMVAYGDPFDHPSVYVGPRKDDGPIVETFHYGDGKWMVSFVYKKDSKDAERGKAVTETNTEDRGGKKSRMAAGEPVIDGGGSIVTGD